MPIATATATRGLKAAPSKKKKTTDKPEETEVDLSQVSAYAVYNNLVPGLSVYEDTSESTHASRQKRNRKNKRKQAEALKKEENKNLESETKAASKSSPGLQSNKSGIGNGGTKADRIAAGGKLINKVAPKNTSSQITSTNSGSSANLNTQVEESTDKPKNKRKLNEDTEQNAASNLNGDSNKKQCNKKSSVTERINENASNGPNETLTKKKKKKKKKAKKSSLVEPIAPTEEDVRPAKQRKLATTESKKPYSDDLVTFVPNPLAKRPANKKVPGSKKTEKAQTPSSLPKAKASFDYSVLPNLSNAVPAPGIIGYATPEDNEDESSFYADDASPPSLRSMLNSDPVEDSVDLGEKLLDWLIHPMTTKGFVKRYWEKRPFVSKRNKASPHYYDSLLTTEKLDAIFRENVLKYGENVDVTMYEDGKRVTVSNQMQGRVRPAVIWDLYTTGHSIRVLNPQTYSKPLWRLNSVLQEKFGSFVGANLYLTPPESQGFAPHYDDIEAFILQIEGKKRWQVYKPRDNHHLARFSSQDFEEGADLGERIFDIVLEPGDIMYFPRGTIHQAKTEEGYHSMHITLSVYQQNSYGDLLKHHFSKCLDKLFASDVKCREGLPMDYLSYMGAAHARNKDKEIIQKRNVFHTKLRSLMSKVFNMDADDAADEMGKKFMWDSLPPFLNRKEKETTVADDGEFMVKGRVRNRVEFDPDVEIKLIRKNIVRLIEEDGTLKLYFSTENPLIYHKDEPNFMELTPELRLPVEHLVKSYPNYVKIEDLPLSNDDTKLNFVSELWENGILRTKNPLQPTEFDDDFDMEFGEDVDSSDQSDGSNVDEESFSDEDDVDLEEATDSDMLSEDVDSDYEGIDLDDSRYFQIGGDDEEDDEESGSDQDVWSVEDDEGDESEGQGLSESDD